MVSDRTQKERRTEFYTQSVEEVEFVDENGQIDETEIIDVTKLEDLEITQPEEYLDNHPMIDPPDQIVDQQHRPNRSHNDAVANTASDLKEIEQEVADRTTPEDQVLPPKTQHHTEGTSGDTFQTPNISEEPSLVVEASGNTQGNPQAQTSGTSGDAFETISVPQGEFETPDVQKELPLIRGNDGNSYQANDSFQTVDGTLIVSPPYTPLDSVSRSWMNKPVHYIAFGAFVTVAVLSVLLVMFGRNSRWSLCRRRRRRKGTLWTNEIKFHDEYTDEESDEPEDFHAHYMVEPHPKSPIDSFGGSKSHDWLGDMNFAVGEAGKQEAKNADNFEEASQYDSDGNSLSNLLNGESSKSNHIDPLEAAESNVDLLGAPLSHVDHLAAPQSPPSSPSLKFAPAPKNSPPTVSEVFQKSMSPHFRSGKKPLPVFDESNTYDELQRQQGDLNQTLFLINDKILEQQRELKVAASALSQKTTRRKHRETTLMHKKITDEITRLDSEKDDIDAKIKTVRTQLKAHRHDRRLKLFSSHD